MDPTDNTPTVNATKVPPPNYGVSLTIMFFVGVLIGFLGRPLMMKNENVAQPPEQKIVEVVVTATPDPNQATAPAKVAEADQAKSAPSLMDMVLADARHFQGNENATVTLIEFSDFRCGYCGRFTAETLKQIRQEYIETGKVRFVFKHLAFLGPESVQAAEATECASEQDKFWLFHDYLFQDLITNHTALNVEVLTSMAEKLGLQASSFKTCLDSGRYSGRISQDTMAAQGMGVRGTPGFLVNGVFLSGAQPFEVFQQIIEEKLKASGK